jgi:hypothetical protein
MCAPAVWEAFCAETDAHCYSWLYWQERLKELESDNRRGSWGISQVRRLTGNGSPASSPGADSGVAYNPTGSSKKVPKKEENAAESPSTAAAAASSRRHSWEVSKGDGGADEESRGIFLA